MEGIRSDDNATITDFGKLTLRDDASNSNASLPQVNRGVHNRNRLAPKGTRQLTSRTRDNYATAQKYKQQGIPEYSKPCNKPEDCQSAAEDTVMADVESGGRRGGGGHGGRGHYNPKKRRFRYGTHSSSLLFKPKTYDMKSMKAFAMYL